MDHATTLPLTAAAFKQSCLYPLGMYWPDFLHIYFGTFESVARGSDLYADIDKDLRSISRFLNHRGARERFIDTCCTSAEDKARLASWSACFFDFKWQYMTRFLRALVPHLRFLAEKYDLKKMRTNVRGDGDKKSKSDLDASILNDMEKALRRPQLYWKTCLLLQLSQALDDVVVWHEGCHCHEHILRGPGSPQVLQQRFQAASQSCMWKGCRQVELVMGGVERHMTAIRNSSITLVAQCIAEASPEDRTMMKYRESTFKEAVVQGLRDKNAFTQMLPYRIVGIVGFLFASGVTKQACIDLVKGIVAEYDSVKEAGKEHRLHRVVQYFFTGELGEQLRGVSNGSRDLSDCSLLIIEVMMYALAPSVCRRAEGVHALIKSNKKRKTAVLAPYISMQLRRPELQEWISSPMVVSWIAAQWKCRQIFDAAILFAFPGTSRAVLKATTMNKRLQIWYLGSVQYFIPGRGRGHTKYPPPE